MDPHPPKTESVILVPLSPERPVDHLLSVARGLARFRASKVRTLPISGSAFAREVLDQIGQWTGATIVLGLLPSDRGNRHPIDAEITAIMHEVAGPIVLVPPGRGEGRWVPKVILAPHDGTPTTAAAIGPALDLAESAGARLVIMHVTEPGVDQPEEPGTITVPRYIDQPQHEWPAWASEFGDRLCALAERGIVPQQVYLTTGDPGREIARFSAEFGIDLIVIGWRGTLEGERAETMKEVISTVDAPILILRA